MFALFISLFALDVFGEDDGFRETLVAFLVHLIPTGLVVLALGIGWRRERAGAMLFVLLALLYLAVSRGRGWILFGPLFLIGILFGVCRQRGSGKNVRAGTHRQSGREQNEPC